MIPFKLCGVTRVADAADLVARTAGWTAPVYVGCVIAEDSPRRAGEPQVREVAAAVRGSTVEPVLVTRGGGVDTWLAAARATGVSRIQWHGATDAQRAALAAAGLQVHRVFAIDAGATDLPKPLAGDPAVPAVLDVGAGGSGRTFDWRLLGGRGPEGVLVAGGITPENLPSLLEHRPWGVDLSSGVERRPGEKDPERVARIVEILEASEVA